MSLSTQGRKRPRQGVSLAGAREAEAARAYMKIIDTRMKQGIRMATDQAM